MASQPSNIHNLVDDLAAMQGSTYLIRFTVAGAPDLTSGASAKMQVRDELPDGGLILELTDGSGITLGATGEIDIRVEDDQSWTIDDTLLVVEQVYVYDLLLNIAGTVTRVAQGKIAALPGVTRPPPPTP